MAAFAVTDWTSEVGTLAEVAAEIETQMETIDSAKTIHVNQVIKIGQGTFQAVMVFDA